MTSQEFCKWMGIEHPIIMAPMFLVSNVEMLKSALDSGITGAIPALNYRTDEELRSAIKSIKDYSQKPFGINLIVNKSNLKYKKQLATCVELKVDFIITSLGSPKETIEQAKPAGIKVICDVTDLNYAKKVEALGADAVIAVNSNAGGHAGPIPPEELIPTLVETLKIPVISAGVWLQLINLITVWALGLLQLLLELYLLLAKKLGCPKSTNRLVSIMVRMILSLQRVFRDLILL